MSPISEKKPIAILINSMVADGAERETAILLKHLQHQFDFHLIMLEDVIEYKLPVNQKVMVIDALESWNNNLLKILKLPWLSYQLYKYLKTHRIKNSVSFLTRSNYINGLLKLTNWKGSIIMNEQLAPSGEYKKNLFKRLIGANLIRLLYRQADLIIPNAEGIKNDLKQNFGLSASKYQVIPSPIDLAYIQSKITQEEPVQYEEYTFITVGRLEKQKQQQVLLKAFAQLEDLPCSLVIIGKGSLEVRLKEKAKELGIQNKVKFMGYQTNPFKYLMNANCFVLSSSHEGCPNVLLEALACKLPIVSTDCQTGPREILAPGTDTSTFLKSEIEIVDHGLLSPVGNADLLANNMRRIYNDQSLAANYHQIAYERVKEYEVKKVINQFTEIFSR